MGVVFRAVLRNNAAVTYDRLEASAAFPRIMQDSTANPPSPSWTWQSSAVLVAAVLFTVCAVAFLWNTSADQGQQRLLFDAQSAFRMQSYEPALELCDRYLQHTPDSSDALLIAARAAMALGRTQEALDYFDRLLEDPQQETEIIAHALGNLQLEQGQVREAERWFRRALELKPDFVLAQQQFAYLLDLQGRRHESLPLRIDLLKRGSLSDQDLFVIGHPEAVLRSADLEKFLKVSPNDPLLRLPEALNEVEHGTPAKAEKLLREVIQGDPNQLGAQAALGNVLLKRTASQAELLGWHQNLPAAAGGHPGIWVVRGLWAQQLDKRRDATRCFWEALRLDPNDRVACLQLSQSLAAEQELDVARILAERADQLQQFVEAVDAFAKGSRGEAGLRRIAELAETLGRLWEAHGWYQIIASQAPQLAWASEGLSRTSSQLSPDTPLVVAEANPIRELDLSRYPVPRFAPSAPSSRPSAVTAKIVFRDVAPAAGIDFQYFNSEDPSTPGRLMFEFTGGGAAVLDFDVDGWPDLYFTQGCRWPPQPQEAEYRDRLYRNRGDGTFVDVTLQAGLGDNSYSQGVAAGDIDNDGYPDLLVANIGANRLYHNEGDGTFSEITEAAGLSGQRWTTSCVIADLNGDSWPDIYEVNYVEGKDVFERRCPRGDSFRICQPTDFSGQADRFFLNLGNGHFADRTEAAGLLGNRGGLGVLVADFAGSGQLSVFVANDMTNNFYFVNSQPRGAAPQFTDEAMLAGLAYDRNGHAQACMGIAADDANGDGMLDLFVTNFTRETNTLYRAVASGLFVDDSHRTGLAAPSLPLLGFGTQFLDGELDGWLDLVVANGHIDDLTDEGIAHEMRPQYFRNLGGTFAELESSQLRGGYFQRRMLGRSLALIDFNKDGREDFVVSHLDLPAALLMNETATAANFLAIKLCGTRSARDAHGTVVSVTAGERQLTRQMVAGSGYQASNQKQLIFGLGAAQQVDVQVRWPSGLEQLFQKVDANQHLVFIEGQGWVGIRDGQGSGIREQGLGGSTYYGLPDP